MNNIKKQRRKTTIENKKFGRLTAIKLDIEKTNSEKRAFWICKCSCGNEKSVRRDSLMNGGVKSCGCLNKDAIRKLAGSIEDVAFARIYRKYKDSANKRNLEITLTIEDIKKIVLKNCYYCGISPENTITREDIKDTYKYSGIDRMDNSIGYIASNCVPCCWTCNCAKRALGKEEFLSWIERIYKYNFNSKFEE